MWPVTCVDEWVSPWSIDGCVFVAAAGCKKTTRAAAAWLSLNSWRFVLSQQRIGGVAATDRWTAQWTCVDECGPDECGRMVGVAMKH